MSLEVIIENRAALPVRTLPFITGWMLSPDVVAMAFANTDHWVTRLEGVTSYHLMPNGQYAPMLPKEWDIFEADLQILSDKLKLQESFDQEKYPEWRKQSIPLLPAGCFVWKDAFEQAFTKSYNKYNYILMDERPGDRELNFVPRIPSDLINIVMQGFVDYSSLQDEDMDFSEEVDTLVEEQKIGRRKMQQLAILEVISKLSYDPNSIPDGGKSKIKSILLRYPQLFTSSGFDHAWHLGVEGGLFRLLNHNKFART